FVDVAAMCLDVITDLSRRYDAALEAERAEGVLAKLVSSDASPASRGVPLIPFRRFAANAHWLNLSSAGRCTTHRAVPYVGRTGIRISIRRTRGQRDVSRLISARKAKYRRDVMASALQVLFGEFAKLTANRP